MQLDKKLDVARMLSEGASPRMIAKALNILPGSVYYQAKILVEEGRIELISKNPAQYQKAKQKECQVSQSEFSSISPPQICVYKKFGASFGLSKKPFHPDLKYNDFGKATIEIKNVYKLEVGRYVAKIWLFSFVGRTLREQRKNGELYLRALGDSFGRKYNVQFAFLRIYEDVEVLIASPETGRMIAQAEGLSWGEKKPVAKAEHKAGDSSDPNNLQINKLKNESPKIPEKQGEILENVLFGTYEERIAKLEERNEKLLNLAEKLTEGQEKLLDGQVAIRQRMDLEAKK